MKKGFTLLETMVAITILAFAIAGPLYAANRSFLAAQLARDRLTASYLAQEGIEYVRLVRDNIYISRYRASGTAEQKSIDAWDNFGRFVQITTNCSANFCNVDSYAKTLAVCGTAVSNCQQLSINGSGQYVQGGGADLTRFRRAVQVTNDPTTPTTDKKVTSTVTWDFHGTTYTTTLSDHLTPWK